MSQRRGSGSLAVVLLVGIALGGAAVAVAAPGQVPFLGPSDDATVDEHVDLTVTNASASAYRAVYRATSDSLVTVQVGSGGAQTGQGSGFVYDDSGHVVTNEHVVRGANTVLVRFHDGSWRDATVRGTDVYTDLAVLDVGDVPATVDPLPVADENPVTGQRVAALGSPLGLEGSITSGIVSGVNRSMRTSEGFSIPATIQTDAPINPGNSGGPLVAMNGTVVGVNRAKSGDNIGFAIPPLLVERVVPGLIASGDYDHAYLGIRSRPVTPGVAEANGLDGARGVAVVTVVDGTPAAGTIQPATTTERVGGQQVPVGGDVIVAIDGTNIRSQQHLARYLMLQTTPGETITVTIVRDGRQRDLQVTLTERPST
jgi:S1-C subfamily serine protease